MDEIGLTRDRELGRTGILLAVLGAGGPVERAGAARTLGEMGLSTAVAALRVALSDPEPEVRESAAYAVACTPGEAAQAALVEMLASSDLEVRSVAVRALGSTPCGRIRVTIPVLVSALADPAGPVREGAANSIGRLATWAGRRTLRQSLGPLVAALADEDRFVRQAAAYALKQMVDQDAAVVLAALLQDGDAYVRELGAMGLADLGDSRAFEPLVAMASGEPVLIPCVPWLGRIGDERAVGVLAGLLNAADADVRSDAALAMGELRCASSGPALVEHLSDTSPAVRAEVARSLKRIGERSSCTVLADLVTGDESADVREAAANAIGLMRCINAVEALAAALGDGAAPVRWAAADALGAIGGRHSVRALLGAVHDTDADVRTAVIEALGKVRTGLVVDKAVHDAIADAASDEVAAVRRAAVEAGADSIEARIDVLMAGIRDDNPIVCYAACLAVLDAGDVEVRRATEELLAEDATSVRWHAVQILREIGDEESLGRLQEVAAGDKVRAIQDAATVAARMIAQRLGQ